MPKLDTLTTKSKKSSEVKTTSEEPFFLQKLANDYGCTDREFHIAFAESIASTPEDLSKLVEQEKKKAKGFLDVWGAYYIIFKKLTKTVSKDEILEKLENVCTKYLKIENKLPREKGEEIVPTPKQEKTKTFITAADIQGKLKNRDKEKPTLSKEFKQQIEENFSVIPKEAKDDLDAELDAMEEVEQEMEEIKQEKKITKVSPGFSTKKAKPISKKVIEHKPTPSKTKGHKRSIIAVFNGGEGSGKSKMAQTFPNAFTLDLEDKLFDLIDYDPELNLQEGDIGEREKRQLSEERDILFATGLTPDDDYVVGVHKTELGDINYIETELNIEAVIGWFMLEGWQYHSSFIIDVGKGIRDASVRAEETRKGRGLGQVEYIPITRGNKQLIIPLIHFCRTKGIHLVIITHWEGVYEARKNAQGYEINVQIGQVPDIKEWMRDLVTWRLDFLKPAESGYDEKFIVDFQKAPGSQYYKLDITNKNLFEILINPERLEAEKEEFRKLRRKRELEEMKEAKK